ncbi:amino acid ABC transporter permease [Glycomyces sp. L485]|uniref:amino acid ABC transporter permease n=1 Tax=Glycomyces sp. L485 TaxID=2909235 RepID=UPI001F4A175F|nr:amino acid ABC transporter permease [Glycomyces sp. L485]MCH7232606.1 amino acid ABC transporter permease [Glycomyces sp. L485]
MDWSGVIDSLPGYGRPLLVTIQVTVAAAALALVVAFGLGLMTSSKHLIVRTPARIVVEFIRGSSVVVQLFWFALAMPILFGFRFDYVIMIGIIALALNYGAYSSEIVRGAIGAVPKGQWEAATALNFSTFQKMRLVIIPQAWPEMIPSLCAFAIMLLKASALVSLVGIGDITFRAETLGGRPGANPLVHFTVILVIYFVLAWLIWTGMRALERRAKRGLGIDIKTKAVPKTAAVLGGGIGADTSAEAENEAGDRRGGDR